MDIDADDTEKLEESEMIENAIKESDIEEVARVTYTIDENGVWCISAIPKIDGFKIAPLSASVEDIKRSIETLRYWTIYRIVETVKEYEGKYKIL